MSSKLIKSFTTSNDLMTKLFSTLDEKKFFYSIGEHLNALVGSDQTIIELISEGKFVKDIYNSSNVEVLRELNEGTFITRSILSNQMPYFSNNLKSDPIFSDVADSNLKSWLSIPVIIEGVSIAIIHFTNNNDSKNNGFQVDDIVAVKELLTKMTAPLINIKMYLTAKNLNNELKKQVANNSSKVEQLTHFSTKEELKDVEIFSYSRPMKGIMRAINKIAKFNSGVLLLGETGVGKEMISQRIHLLSNRNNKNFVSIDASLFNELEFEKEVFGYEVHFDTKTEIKNGLLEIVNGGTIFINNIDKLELTTQEKLSKFVVTGLGNRVHGNSEFRSDVRLIVATTKNIKNLVSDLLFDSDFYTNISSVEVIVPSLNDRFEDIEFLANYYLNKNSSKDEQKALSPAAIKALKNHTWVGNVRELISLMERGRLLSEGQIVEVDHFLDGISEQEENNDIAKRSFNNITLMELEKEHITDALVFLNGNKTKTAELLGITVKTLYNKLHSYGLINKDN